MKCEYCDNEVPPGSTRCPSCGAAVKVEPQPQAYTAPAGATPQAQPASANTAYKAPAKSRVAYIVLAILLGEFGIHNFYAGYMSRGVIQLLVSLLGGSMTCGVSSLGVWIWAIVEACTVTADQDGVPFN